MALDLAKATSFIKSIDLSGTPRSLVSLDAAAVAGEVFDKAKNQAQVVGSGLFSFEKGVDVAVREAISDSALLAQLVANKNNSVQASPMDWFKSYADVLAKVGWDLQDAQFNDYTNEGNAAEVNEKILEVMTAAFGAAPTALAIITSTINALKAMNPDSPWITIFSRESQKAKIARFQIGLVNQGENDDVFVSMVACLVEAQNTITQVLFFKFRAAKASFKASSQKLSINKSSLTDLGPAIRAKVRAYQMDYLSSIKDL